MSLAVHVLGRNSEFSIYDREASRRHQLGGIPAASVAGAAVRYPVPDGGFVIHPSGPAGNIVGTIHALTLDVGWDALIEDIEEMADDSDFGDDFIWAALTPRRTGPPGVRYANNGVGHPYSENTFLGIVIEDAHACFAAQRTLPATFAHELGHAFGFYHAGCADTGIRFPTDVDPGLPIHTEDFGFDGGAGAVVPAGTGELMSYCGAQARWPSIVFWDRMFDR